MKRSELEALAEALAPVIRDHIAKSLAPLSAELERLKAAQAEFRYFGVWERGCTYREGNFVTDDGSLWACLRDTGDRPGASLDWQLAVKRGKDGRDA